MIIVSWLLVFTIGGCGHGIPENPDKTPPTITVVFPVNGATGVPSTAAVTATFNEDMDSSSINITTFTLGSSTESVLVRVTYNSSIKTVTCSPLTHLSYYTTYTATVAASVKDLAGNAMGTPYSWRFTIGPDTTPPSFEGLSSLTVNSSSKITLGWTAATDDGTPASQMNYLIYQGASASEVLAMTTPTYTTTEVTSYQVRNLNQGGTYYFLVRAQDSSGNKDNNTVTRNGTANTLSAPKQISPLSCQVVGSTLKWATATYAEQYQIQLDDSRTFASPNEVATVSATSYTPTTTGILFWRVRAKEDYNYSSWSPTWEVTLGKTAGDVNADGYTDVIVGAMGADSNTGKAYVFRGGSTLTGSLTTGDADAYVTMIGETAGDFFGYPVSSAGDVNGDLYADVIIGAYGNNAGTGKAYIYLGGNPMNNVPDVTFTGVNVADNFGEKLSGGGDINGDGYADVIVGARFANAGGSDKGEAYVYFGGDPMDSTADVTISGAINDDRVGYPAIIIGDVNGDGFSDILVGSIGQKKCYIYFGSASLSGSKTLTDANVTINLVSFACESASGLGDINGDGYADLVIGGNNTAYVFLGGPTLTGNKAITSADITVNAENTGDGLGNSCSNAGDVNSDGYADLLIGAPNLGTNAGKAYLFYGSPTLSGIQNASGANFIIESNSSPAYLGWGVSGAVRLNGDNYSDMVVGADGLISNEGKTFIYFGSASLSGTKTNAQADANITDSGSNVYFGVSVSGSLNQ